MAHPLVGLLTLGGSLASQMPDATYKSNGSQLCKKSFCGGVQAVS